MNFEKISKEDEAIYALMQKELKRQQNGIESGV